MAIPLPDDQKYDVLYVTLGENPMPAYLAALSLLKKHGRLVVIGSEASLRDDAGRPLRGLRQALAEHHVENITSLEVHPEDLDKCMNKVMTNVEEQLGKPPSSPFAIDITGGRKAMSTASAMAALRCGGVDRAITYLSPTTQEFQTTKFKVNGPATWMKVGVDTALNLKTIAALHGFDVIIRTDLSRSHQLDNLVTAITHFAKQHPISELHDLLRNLRDKHKEAIENGVPMPAPQVDGPTADIEKKVQACSTYFGNALTAFLKDRWLEVVTAHFMKALLSDVDYSVEFKRKDGRTYKCEIDAAGVFHNRLVFVSCTTSNDASLAKHKLFEVKENAQLVGGDQAIAGVLHFAGTAVAGDLNGGVLGDDPKVRTFSLHGNVTMEEVLKSWFLEIKNWSSNDE
jgi:hypothetical protein